MSDTAFAPERAASLGPSALAPRYDKPGQPTAYKPEYANLAFKYCLLGAKELDLARNFDVSIATITNWKQEHPEFLASIRKGREQGDAEVAHSLYKRATGYEAKATKVFMPAGSNDPVYAEYMEHVPPDVSAALRWLQNRQPEKWRDYKSVDLRVTHEHTLNEQTQDLLNSLLSSLAEDDSNTLIDATATLVDDKSTK